MVQTASSPTAASNYLDLVDEKQVKNVLRYLSVTPRSPSWWESIRENDMIASLRTHPRLRAAARTVLTRLATYPPAAFFDSDEHPCIVKWGHLREVTEAAGDLLQELRLGFGHHFRNVNMERLMPSIMGILHGLPLRNISIRLLDLTTLKDESADTPVIGAVLTATCGRVETLKMQGVHAHLLAEHCEKVKKLDLQYPPQSPHAGDERTSLAYSEGLWEAIGGDLEEVTIMGVAVGRDIIRKMHTFCKKLRGITFSEADDARDAYVDLLVSRGSEMQDAVMPRNISPSSRERLLAECTNVRFTCAWVAASEKDNTSQVASLANSVKVLILNLHRTPDADAQHALWAGCSRLETFVLYEWQRGELAQTLPDFAAEGGRSLRTLRLNFQADVSAHSLRCVGRWTGALQVLHLTLRPTSREKLQRLEGLDKVAEGNPALKEVWVNVHLGSRHSPRKVLYGPLVEERDMVGVVRSFGVCPALKVLLVQDVDFIVRVHRKSALIGDACTPFRFREGGSPFISVLGVHYT